MKSNLRPVFPEICKHCTETLGPHHWKWIKNKTKPVGGYWACGPHKRRLSKLHWDKRKQDPTVLAKRRARSIAFSKANPLYRRYFSYKYWDKQKYGITAIISQEKAMLFMQGPCFYCGKPSCGGLDRRDSSLGHTEDNVVSCCSPCNQILGDIPVKAKDALIPGLKRIFTEELLGDWKMTLKRKR